MYAMKPKWSINPSKLYGALSERAQSQLQDKTFVEKVLIGSRFA
jgi:hypothetical protein